MVLGKKIFLPVLFLLCFVSIAKKECQSECQQPEFPEQLPKRQRISSRANSDENPADAIDLQILNVATPPNTDGTCALETSLADLPEVIHLLETKENAALVSWRGSFKTIKLLFSVTVPCAAIL